MNSRVFIKVRDELFMINFLKNKELIYSARWNSKGNLIVSSSDDNYIKILDFHAGSVLHQEKTCEGGIPLELTLTKICFRRCTFSMFYWSKLLAGIILCESYMLFDKIRGVIYVFCDLITILLGCSNQIPGGNSKFSYKHRIYMFRLIALGFC